MRKSLLLIVLLTAALITIPVSAQPFQIEVFDVIQSKVIKEIPIEEKMTTEAEKLVKSADSLFPKLNPTPRTGIMIKVPFEPPLDVKTAVLTQPVKQVIFILPEGDRPYMLIFDKEDQPMFYYFSEDASEFLNILGVK
jgi:hypothetical protein